MQPQCWKSAPQSTWQRGEDWECSERGGLLCPSSQPLRQGAGQRNPAPELTGKGMLHGAHPARCGHPNPWQLSCKVGAGFCKYRKGITTPFAEICCCSRATVGEQIPLTHTIKLVLQEREEQPRVVLGHLELMEHQSLMMMLARRAWSLPGTP